MRLDVQGQAPSRGLSGDWRSATLRLEAEATGADLAHLHESLPFIPALEGTAGVDLRFNGSVDSPERLELFAAVSELRVPSMGLQVPRVELEAQLREGSVTVHASASEPNSPYVLLDSDFTFDRAAWEQDPLAILQAPWSIHLVVPDRELTRMPLRELEGLPGRVQLSFSLEGGDQTTPLGGPSGVLQAAYRLPAGEHEGCIVPRSAIEVGGSLDDGRLEVEAALYARGQSLGHLRARSLTPIEQWIQTPPDQLPLVDVDVDVDGVQLSDVPYLCDTLTGSVAVDGTLRHVFGSNPVADLVARVQGLRV